MCIELPGVGGANGGAGLAVSDVRLAPPAPPVRLRRAQVLPYPVAGERLRLRLVVCVRWRRLDEPVLQGGDAAARHGQPPHPSAAPHARGEVRHASASEREHGEAAAARTGVRFSFLNRLSVEGTLHFWGGHAQRVCATEATPATTRHADPAGGRAGRSPLGGRERCVSEMTLALSEVFMADVPEKNLSCPLRCDVPKGEEWKTAKPSDWGQVRVWGGPRMSQMLREMLTRRRETELSNMPILSFRITNDAPRTGLAVRAEKTHASNILQYLKRGTVVKMYVPKAMIKEGAKLKLPNWACLTYPVFHGWICTKANG